MKNILYYLIIMSAGVVPVMNMQSAVTPYIPSYDDRYAEDMRQAERNKNYFTEPADALNYADYHYVGAHAAEKYARFFPQFALQDQPIPGLLTLGVRGLMLTLYNWSLSWSTIIKEGISIVCSHPAKESGVFRKNGKPLYQTLHYEMNRIFNFLKSHPKAVITLLCDDCADIATICRDMKEVLLKNSYDPLLKPADWSLAQQKGEWPTLGWMRSNNKRLLLFTQTYDQHTEYTWPMKDYFWENIYGTTDENIMCTEEKVSALVPNKKNRSLVSFGCFGAVSVSPDARDSKNCFEYDSVKRFTLSCQSKNFAHGKLFNGYWADHIVNTVNALVKDNKKTAFDYVNELNVIQRK
jgi:hypothetical protein